MMASVVDEESDAHVSGSVAIVTVSMHDSCAGGGHGVGGACATRCIAGDVRSGRNNKQQQTTTNIGGGGGSGDGGLAWVLTTRVVLGDSVKVCGGVTAARVFGVGVDTSTMDAPTANAMQSKCGTSMNSSNISACDDRSGSAAA